jgi:hypothetical protein
MVLAVTAPVTGARLHCDAYASLSGGRAVEASDPAAVPTATVYAPWWIRIAATLIDLGVVSVPRTLLGVLVIVAHLDADAWVGAVGLVSFYFYLVALEATRGQTLGKMVFKSHVIRAGIEAWAADHSNLYPPESEVNAEGLDKYLAAWPPNAHTLLLHGGTGAQGRLQILDQRPQVQPHWLQPRARASHLCSVAGEGAATWDSSGLRCIGACMGRRVAREGVRG